MDFNEDLPKFFQRKESSRHHYIPRFLIQGFTNDAGFLYVYDKDKDKILKNPQSPKGVFFENDRNTIETIKGQESSVIEDLIYARMDNEASPIIKYLQEVAIDKFDPTQEQLAKLLFFLVNLFWRIPYTDFAVKDVLDHTTIAASGADPEKLRNDVTFQKLQRAGLFKHAIDEMVKNKSGRKSFANVHHFHSDLLVLSDNPILFERVPTSFAEFDKLDYVFAVSSHRIFSSTASIKNKFDRRQVFEYNASVITQATRFVASGNRDALEMSVHFYKELARLGIGLAVIQNVFKQNN